MPSSCYGLQKLRSLAAWLSRHGQHVRTLRLRGRAAAGDDKDSVAVALATCVAIAGAAGQLEQLQVSSLEPLHTEWLTALRSVRHLGLATAVAVKPLLKFLTRTQTGGGAQGCCCPSLPPHSFSSRAAEGEDAGSWASAATACLAAVGAAGQLTELSFAAWPETYTGWLCTMPSLKRLCLRGGGGLHIAPSIEGLSRLQSLGALGRSQACTHHTAAHRHHAAVCHARRCGAHAAPGKSVSSWLRQQWHGKQVCHDLEWLGWLKASSKC